MNLSLNEAIDVAQNRPLRILMSTFGATHSKWCWCMPEMNECRETYEHGNGKTANSSILTTALKFEDVPARNAFKYLQMIYIARNVS